MGEIFSTPEPVCKEKFERIWAQTTKIDWTQDEACKLRGRILQTHTVEGRPIKPKILIFGPTGMGKSSLCNGIVSAVNDSRNVSSYFAAGSIAGSFTKGFHGKKLGDLWLIDMGGIYESSSITDDNIKEIASGKVPFYAKLTENLEVKDREKCMIPAPGKNDVSCVVIVLSLGAEIPHEIKRQLRCIMGLAGEGVISYRLILTHVDICDGTFRNPSKLPSVFDSKAVQEAVLKVAQDTGVPASSISVVRNYANEPETDLHSNILFLHAMDKVVSAACEQVEKKVDQQRLREELNEGGD